MNKMILALLFLSASSFADNSTVINVKLLGVEKETVAGSGEKQVVDGEGFQDSVLVNEANTKGEAVSETSAEVVTGVRILKGTVNANIVRIAEEFFGIPEENVEFVFMPCELVEKYTYTIPEEKITNKYERLTFYASQYSFFTTFNTMTNTVTLEYRGPDVFDKCRKTS